MPAAQINRQWYPLIAGRAIALAASTGTPGAAVIEMPGNAEQLDQPFEPLCRQYELT